MSADLVLDTCTFLWLATVPAELTPAAREEIEAARQPSVSAITLTEIHRLVRRGSIELPCSPHGLNGWFSRALKHHSLTCEPITAEIAHAAEMLPGHHQDPADRFIIATAVVNRCAVVTADEIFPKYKITVVWK